MNRQNGCVHPTIFLGSLLGKFNHAKVPLPGGCNFGVRPIDLHLKGFKALGADWNLEYGIVNISAQKLIGSSIYLDMVSVGATINIMLAAVKMCIRDSLTEV